MRILATLLLGLLVLPGFAGPETAPAKPKKKPPVQTKIRSAKQLINFLETRRISAKFEKATLDQVVSYLRKATGINVVVMKARIEKDGGDADAIEISLEVDKVSIRDFLKLAFEPHGLGLAVRGNLLVITSKKAARGKPVLVVYDISEALIQIRDFPAPDINVYPSSYEPPEPPEPEIHQAVESSEELAEMVRQFCGKETWEDEGVSLTPFRRHLFVRQYPHVHSEIRRFLAAVRALR